MKQAIAIGLSTLVLAATGCSATDGGESTSNGGTGTTGGSGGAGAAGGSTPSTGGSTPGTGGSTPGTGGSTPGTGGSTPSSGGTAAGTGGSTSGTGGATITPELPPVVNPGECEPGAFEIRELGQVQFEGQTYPVVIATPCSYSLPYVQQSREFSVEETDDYYMIDSNFELPYVPGITDLLLWTPGERNRGWAMGEDPEAAVAEHGAGRTFLYHVMPDHEYGYFTYTNDPLPDDWIHYSAFRPTWYFREEDGQIVMYLLDPLDPDKYGFEWPRHGDNWDLKFGLYVDPQGRVYVPKNAPLALPWWDDYMACVVINRASAPVPTTRTQFPGSESYYAAETFLPGYASLNVVGHRYWGQKGRPMEEVAVWENNLPGNFHKPYGNGCSKEGYDFGHAEGFTWPELREEMHANGVVIPRERLYRITLYKVPAEGETELLGSLFYEEQDGMWFPNATGPALNPLDESRNTYHINGPVFRDRGERVFAVIEDL